MRVKRYFGLIFKFNWKMNVTNETNSKPLPEDLPSFDEVMARLKTLVGIGNQSALASALDLTPSSVSDAKRRGLFPLAWALRLARVRGVSLNCILGLQEFGQNASSSLFPKNGAHREDFSARPPAELVYVDKVRARLSAGTGRLEVEADPLGQYAFRRDWISLKGSPAQMVLMDVVGDSMEPEIRHGDMALIDQSQTEVIGGALYAVGVEDTVYVKRVDRLPGKLCLTSINPVYKPIEIDMHGDLAETVRIIGHVIWWCREAN